MKIKNTFRKEERLCSRKQMEVLFAKGRSFNAYPVKLVYIETLAELGFPVQAMFVAPKRNFKKASDRNKLKRRMKEVYRLNKNSFYSDLKTKDKKFALALIYTGKKLEEYAVIETSILKMLGNLVKR